MENCFSSQDMLKSDSSQSSETADDSSSNNSTWCGTSIEDLLHKKSPWNFYIPPLNVSRHHTVLIELPINLKELPKPHISANTCHWDLNHVRMPFSPKNLFPSKENNEDILKPRWDIIQCTLLRNIENSHDFEEAIFSYNLRKRKLLGLHNFFENVLEEDESNHFFQSLFPKIVKLALQLPDLIQTSIPLLKQGRPHAISLSQMQIASLLANAFLCTFPQRKDNATYQRINFNGLFEKDEPEIIEKIKCIIHYFRRVCENPPIGVVTFERRHLPKNQFPRWDKSDKCVSNIKLHISNVGTIEDGGKGMLQVDFANSFIGGGVLGFGCVQEEIRFVICPELLVSLLFTEQLAPNEALLMIGAECYSNYSGYASSFQWAGNHKDITPVDDFGRRKTSIVAIDALFYGHSSSQFAPSKMIRELNKAFVGFHESRVNNASPLSPVATGNWGCGAFRGNLHLKAIIQIMACTATNRNIVYYTFGDKKLQYAIYNIFHYLVANNVTIVQLWRYLCKFAEAKISKHQLLPFLKQSHLDNLSNSLEKAKQTNIKDILTKFSVNNDNEKQIKKNSLQKKNSSDNLASQPSTSKQNNALITRSNIRKCTEDPLTNFAESQKKFLMQNDDVIEPSQEDIDLTTIKSPPKMKKYTDNKTSNVTKNRKAIKPIDDIFGFDDEEDKFEKREGFLLQIDHVGSEVNKEAVMDVTSDELMEICLENPEKNNKFIKKDNTPLKNNADIEKNKTEITNKKPLITDFFLYK